MRALKYLLRKEFLQIFRNRTTLAMIIMMPTIQLLIMPWATTYEQRNISLCVVDHDKSTTSRQLVEKITSSGYFKLTGYEDSFPNAMHAVEQNNTDVVLEIPVDFEKRLFREKNADLMLNINAVNGQKAGLGLSYIGQIIEAYMRDMIPQNSIRKPEITLKPYYRYNVKLEYFPYMVPGIFAILITVMTGILSAQNIVREKEMGTIEQINATPISKPVFILGKIIPFWVIGLVILTIGMFIAWSVYGVLPAGSVLALYLYSFLYIITFTGLGIVISNYANTQQQAMLIAFFFLMITILLSGLFSPVSSMPEWAKTVTLFNPMRYFVEVIRMIYLKGSGLPDMLPQIVRIGGFIIFFNAWGIISYRKTNG